MGLSRRAYAAHRGCSESAVRKAIATGRIVTEADGTIDAARADAMWDARTDPAQQRGAHARATAAETAATTATAKAALNKPVPRAALDAVKDTLREAGSEPGAAEGGGEVSFVRARMANEVLKAQTARVRLQKMKGELVDRARATAMVFDLARRERDAWLNWPPRVAALMAAELGVEAHQMETVLERHVRAHLGELAEVKVELR
ncbi:elements of external origin [Paracoccus bogoriensis]|nr:elements of external origin [Paracoccus bogoriensis]MBW7057533.1 elements of external origin [Paracoccus bogoriensis]